MSSTSGAVTGVALVIQLVDSRMPPTALDLQLADWLDSLGLPRLVVATKADKLSGNQQGCAAACDLRGLRRRAGDLCPRQ